MKIPLDSPFVSNQICCLTWPPEAKPKPVQKEIDHGSRVKREYLAEDQTPCDRDAQRPPELRSSAPSQRQRKCSEESCHIGHHDGTKAEYTCLEDRLFWTFALDSLCQKSKIDHHDCVLLHNSDEQHDADQRDYI